MWRVANASVETTIFTDLFHSELSEKSQVSSVNGLSSQQPEMFRFAQHDRN
jgi:hypothetical protein